MNYLYILIGISTFLFLIYLICRYLNPKCCICNDKGYLYIFKWSYEKEEPIKTSQLCNCFAGLKLWEDLGGNTLDFLKRTNQYNEISGKTTRT